jgi:hypothetical protein
MTFKQVLRMLGNFFDDERKRVLMLFAKKLANNPTTDRHRPLSDVLRGL